MWHILKTEFRYNMMPLAIALGLIAFLLLIGVIVVRHDPTSSFQPTLLYIGTLYIVLYRSRKEKRGRLYRALPVSAVTVALARVLAQAPFWVGAILVYAAARTTAVTEGFTDTVVATAAVSGIIVWANAAYLISFDIGARVGGGRRLLKSAAVAPVWVVTFTLGVFFAKWHQFGNSYDMPAPVWIEPLFTTVSGSALFHILGILLTGVSVLLYLRRKSYADSGSAY